MSAVLVGEERELDLRRECSVFLRKYLLKRRLRGREAVLPKGAGGSKPSENPVTSKANGQSSRAMGRESSVDARDSDISRIIEDTAIEEARVPNGLAPTSLPSELREDPMSVEESAVRRLYDPASAVRLVDEGTLTHLEVLVLYLRAFDNILTFEVSDTEQLRNRFMGFFATAFMELVELCHPNRGNTSLVSLHALRSWHCGNSNT